VAAVFAQVKREFGSIDILVNNAGTLDHMAQIEDQSDDLWERDLRVNLTGAYNCTKAAWPHMREQNWGRIIFMSSVAGTLGALVRRRIPRPRQGSRAGQVDGPRGARFGITSNMIAPGIIATEAFTAGNPRMNERMVLRTAMRSMGEPRTWPPWSSSSPHRRRATSPSGHPRRGGIDLFVY